MIRVVEVIATFDGAGAERQMAALALGLDRGRFEVEALALTRGGPVRDVLERGGVRAGVIGKRAKLDPLALARLCARIRALAPDVVHTHMFTASAYGRAAGLLARAPALVATEASPDPWKGRLHAAIDRALARRSARVVCASEAILRANLDRGIPEERLLVIHNGVDARAVAREAEAGGPREPWRIFAAARLAPEKDLVRLVEAVSELRGRGHPATLHIAGEGPERPRIEAAISRLGVSSAVRLLGHRDDVARLLGGASCFALASRYEGFGVAAAEAMAAGLPVVAPSAGGLVEVVAHGETGILVPPGDAPALARALERVLADPALGRALGERGRARVRERFSLEVMVAGYERVFEEAARLTRGGRRPINPTPP